MAASSSMATVCKPTCCHQCRQNTTNLKVFCKALKETKQCVLKYCHKCLWNRYEEKVENLEDWICPKCRGICDCSQCMKHKGEQPKGKKRAVVDDDEKPDEEGIANYEDQNNIVGVPAKSGARGGKKKSKKLKLDGSNEKQNTDSLEDISFPVGSELNSVAGNELSSENVGNALQLLEFCIVFGKALEMEEGQAEYVLRDILHGSGQAEESSIVVQFHIQLLTILKDDRGEDYPEMSSSSKDSWFSVLKDHLSGSQRVLKAHGLDIIENVDDYETLDVSQKLRLLNILCDEVLATEKVRTWIEDEDNKHSENVKEMNKKVADCRDEEKKLKNKMKADIVAAILAKNGVDLSSSEKKDIVSSIKPEIEKAHAEVLKSKGILEKNKHKPDAVRLEPILISGCNAYWKLNVSDKANVLCQNVGKGDDTLSLNEEWTNIDDVGKNTIERKTQRKTSQCRRS